MEKEALQQKREALHLNRNVASGGIWLFVRLWTLFIRAWIWLVIRLLVTVDVSQVASWASYPIRKVLRLAVRL
jgi:hypothetical protein